jgi:AcrR family transcriptional regulator
LAGREVSTLVTNERLDAMAARSRANGDSQERSPEDPAAKGEPTSAEPQTRRSREETTAAILDAAEDLFSRRDPNTVTIREIAEKAGVTHPLVHQYVGSKQAILDAVITRGAPRRHKVMTEHPDLREAVPLLIADVLSRRVHSRAVLRSAMDGVNYASFEDRVDTGRMLLGLADESVARQRLRPQPSGAMDSRIVMAAMTALAYGWVGTQDWLVKIFDLEGEDPAELQRQIADIGLYVTDLILAPAENSESDGG